MNLCKGIRITILSTVLLLMLATSAQSEELRLSVAASMTEVFKELIARFNSQHPEVTILPNFGPSGGLAKQISLGAPADLYVSANSKWMDYLVDQGKIELSTHRDFAYNSLVFLGQKDINVTSLGDLPALQRIGLGSPKNVPAGQYAAQAMNKFGIYDQLLQDGKLVMAKDVRQALIYADRGETDGSFVYRTDAVLAQNAVILFVVPQQLYDRVTYPVGLTTEGAAKPSARAFSLFIGSNEGKTVLQKYGFSTPD